MSTVRHLFSAFTLGGGVILSGCAAETVEQDSPGEEAHHAPTDVADPANGNVQCCWGHCTSSQPFVRPEVWTGCRDKIVDVCHYHGYHYHPNGDAWWGTCAPASTTPKPL